MTEVASVVAVCALGLLSAVILVRALLAQPVREDLAKSARALDEALRGLSSPAWRAGAIAVVGAAATVAVVTFGHRPEAGVSASALAAVAAGVVLGAGAVVGARVATSRIAAIGAARVSSAMAADVRADAARAGALQTGLRCGAAAGLAAMGLAAVSGALVLLLALALAPRGAAETSCAEGLEIATPLVAHGLAVALASRAAKLAGGAFGAAAARADGPAAIARLAASLDEAFAARALDVLEALGIELAAAPILAAAIAPHGGTCALLPWTLLPLAPRAFGLLASAVAVASVATDGLEDPMRALARGRGVALFLTTLGVAGACFWLAAGRWAALFAAGATGVIASALAGHGDVGPRPGGGGAIRAVWRAPVVLVFAWAVAYELAEQGIGAGAGGCGVLAASAAAASSAPYLVATNAVGALAGAAPGFAEIAETAAPRVEPSSPLGRALPQRAAAQADGYFAAVAACAAATGVLAYHVVSGPHAERMPGAVAMLAGAIAAAALASGAAMTRARAASAVAARLVAEVRRQLSSVPVFVGDFVPNHRAAAATLAREALRRMASVPAIAVACTVAVGVAAKHALGAGADATSALIVAAVAIELVVAFSASPGQGDRRAIDHARLVVVAAIVAAPLVV